MHPMRIGAYAMTGVWALLTPWAALRGDALTFALGAGVLLLAAFQFRPAREPEPAETDEQEQASR